MDTLINVYRSLIFWTELTLDWQYHIPYRHTIPQNHQHMTKSKEFESGQKFDTLEKILDPTPLLSEMKTEFKYKKIDFTFENTRSDTQSD